MLGGVLATTLGLVVVGAVDSLLAGVVVSSVTLPPPEPSGEASPTTPSVGTPANSPRKRATVSSFISLDRVINIKFAHVSTVVGVLESLLAGGPLNSKRPPKFRW